jgi:hypothetical protein
MDWRWKNEWRMWKKTSLHCTRTSGSLNLPPHESLVFHWWLHLRIFSGGNSSIYWCVIQSPVQHWSRVLHLWRVAPRPYSLSEGSSYRNDIFFGKYTSLNILKGMVATNTVKICWGRSQDTAGPSKLKSLREFMPTMGFQWSVNRQWVPKTEKRLNHDLEAARNERGTNSITMLSPTSESHQPKTNLLTAMTCYTPATARKIIVTMILNNQ